MNTLIKLPGFVKISLFIIGTYFFISMLSIAQEIILPILFAIIIAIALSPAINYLVKRKINRTLSIAIVLIIVSLLVAALIALTISQASRLIDAWPKLANKLQVLLLQTVAWASEYFNIRPEKIDNWMMNSKDELIAKSSTALSGTLSKVGGVLASVVLTPVYIFMILYYQSHLLEFTHKLFRAHNNNVSEVLTETRAIVQSYLSGLFIEFTIVAVLNTIGLLLLGIDYAILLGVLGAFLNVIPYLGGVICVALFIIIALLTKAPVFVVYVIALYSIIQFFDNNYIVPKIVGSKVKLNALVSVISVILGAGLWGVSGMFLSIPLIAILKLIFDRIDSLKPWGFLLGDTMPTGKRGQNPYSLKSIFSKRLLSKIKK